MELQTDGKMLREFRGKRRYCSFQEQIDSHQVTYKRFKRRIFRRSHLEGPTASTPVAAGWQCEPSFEFDAVCQRLELDSPPRQSVCQENPQGAHQVRGVSLNAPCTLTAAQNATEQKWVWTDAAAQQACPGLPGSDDRGRELQPFAVLSETVSEEGKTLMKLAAPSLQNDYYTSLLDCSCAGVVALALGSRVYLWNSETRALAGHLRPRGGPPSRDAVTSLCWSSDGAALCVGTRRGEVQLWDVEHKQSVRPLVSHLSAVGALSWKQHLLSSGSVLGRVHHLDPRAPAPLVGAAVQGEGLCGLQWSPGGDQLASGSTEGLLHIWDGDITGVKRSRRPVTTMKQPSAVKAMGWCPWRRDVIATGGGWTDGQLRIWDADAGSCLTSVDTNSQICCVRWAERAGHLVTGHGVPRHEVTCWSWDFPSVQPACHLMGHSERVLHLAMNPDNTKIFSAGADQFFHIWDL